MKRKLRWPIYLLSYAIGIYILASANVHAWKRAIAQHTFSRPMSDLWLAMIALATIWYLIDGGRSLLRLRRKK